MWSGPLLNIYFTFIGFLVETMDGMRAPASWRKPRVSSQQRRHFKAFFNIGEFLYSYTCNAVYIDESLRLQPGVWRKLLPAHDWLSQHQGNAQWLHIHMFSFEPSSVFSVLSIHYFLTSLLRLFSPSAFTRPLPTPSLYFSLSPFLRYLLSSPSCIFPVLPILIEWGNGIKDKCRRSIRVTCTSSMSFYFFM